MTDEQWIAVLGREFSTVHLQVQALVDLTCGQAAFDDRLRALSRADGKGAHAALRREVRKLVEWATALTPDRLARLRAFEDDQWLRWRVMDLDLPESP